MPTRLLLLTLLLASPVAFAQEDGGEEDPPAPAPGAAPAPEPPEGSIVTQRNKPPSMSGAQTINLDFVGMDLTALVRHFAEITGRNFLITEDLKGQVTIISHQPVTVAEAYEAFLSALETAGYTTVTVGNLTKIVPVGDAANTPLRVYEGGNIPYTDNYVTQIIQLENVSANDIRSIVQELGGKSVKVIAYAPTNTLIVTDSAVNIRRVYRIISQLDVKAPTAKLEIIPLQHATAADVEKVIQELYGTAETASTATQQTGTTATARRTARQRAQQEAAAATPSSTSTVGQENKYIEKIISDERTNSLIILANEEALAAVRALIAELDQDVDPSRYAQIHVVYLEHAKSEDVATVLSNLASGSSSSSSSSTSRTGAQNRQTQTQNQNQRTGATGRTGAAGGAADTGGLTGGDSSAVAAFDSGVRITSDENTNSLVIIATPDQYRILKGVIDKLDIRRKQVFVEAVILELASEDTSELGLGVHMGRATGDGEDGAVSILSGQLGASSLGLSQDLLSGMAIGVFGPNIDVAYTDPTTGEAATLAIPVFGVVLNALQSNSAVNILSTPNILTMDNEEAKIVVGRNIPFPVSNSFSNNGTPVISYQREDVAITLQVTPQINESNYVTMEVFQEVQEVEEDDSGLDVTSAGFITSKRSAETTVVIRDNQTVVLGGLMGSTDTEVESKIPLLGDLPLIGKLFRGNRTISRKTNLLIFLTPHIIDEPEDLQEVYQIKVAQRQEFLERFYGKSRAEQEEELSNLLRYSMNQLDEPSFYRGTPEDTDLSIQLDFSSGDPDEPVPPGADPSSVPDIQDSPGVDSTPGDPTAPDAADPEPTPPTP